MHGPKQVQLQLSSFPALGNGFGFSDQTSWHPALFEIPRSSRIGCDIELWVCGQMTSKQPSHIALIHCGILDSKGLEQSDMLFIFELQTTHAAIREQCVGVPTNAGKDTCSTSHCCQMQLVRVPCFCACSETWARHVKVRHLRDEFGN